MRIETLPPPTNQWPTLCWAARFRRSSPGAVCVWAGAQVESGAEFIVEGVWPGEFAEGRFDDTELFFGSGLRIKDGKVRFVSSCSSVDRLWSYEADGSIYVSNSLPALSAVTNIGLIPSEARYASWIETIVRGKEYQRTLPASKGDIAIHYMEDVEIGEDGTVQIVSKPQNIRPFPSYESYKEFLYSTARTIGDNAKSAQRTNPMDIVSTVSRGYDSPVATVLAREAGASKAMTLTTARSLLPRSDSGVRIAEQLGVPAEAYDRGASGIRDELCYWVANGSVQDMNMSIFNFPKSPTVLMSGFNGGWVWGRDVVSTTTDPLARRDTTGLGFCEHRLVQGVIHCPVPFWGIKQLASIRRLANSEEMNEWSLGGNYDRPVPRRILEEEGIGRHEFGTRKSATSMDESVLWPLSSKYSESYRAYLEGHGLPVPGVWQGSTGRKIVAAWRQGMRARYRLLAQKLKLPQSAALLYPWEKFLMPWAVDEHVNEYFGASRSKAGR